MENYTKKEKSKTIITTVGTSLFTNYLRNLRNSTHYELFSQAYNILLNIPASKYKNYTSEIKTIKEIINTELLSNNANIEEYAAEIKSLINIKKNIESYIISRFISTDTLLSVVIAELLRDFFEYFSDLGVIPFFSRDTDCIPDLQLKDVERFRDGLMNLFRRLEEIKKKSEEVGLNITGGYKGVIPYLTIWAQINKAPLYYIFEFTNEVIEIPPLPIDFNFTLIDDNYAIFEKIKEGKPYFNYTNDPLVNEAFIFLEEFGLVKRKENKIVLTPVGDIMRREYMELTRSNKYHRRSILSQNIEYKVFEYFLKYELDGIISAECSKKLSPNYEYDLFIEKKDKLIIGEVKPAKGWFSKKGGIKFKFDTSFSFIQKRCKKPVEIKIILYIVGKNFPDDLVFLDRIKELTKLYRHKYDSIKWYLLKIPLNYGANPAWKVTSENIKRIL